MASPLYLLYLDRYHQGDPLFLKELAQRFARLTPGQIPTLLVHTAGEKLERTLEAEGLFPEREGGVVQTETPRQAALAERAAREANQDLVALFTDEQVSVVGLQGADRSLLRCTDEGAVATGGLGWVADLVKMRVVPVVSSLAVGPDGTVAEAPPAATVVALAEAFAAFEVTLCFLASGDVPDAPLAASGAALEEAFAEPSVARRAAAAFEGAVLLTDLNGFFHEGGPRGAQLQPAPQ